VRNDDLLAYGHAAVGDVVIGVEAKVNEPLDARISDTYAAAERRQAKGSTLTSTDAFDGLLDVILGRRITTTAFDVTSRRIGTWPIVVRNTSPRADMLETDCSPPRHSDRSSGSYEWDFGRDTATTTTPTSRRSTSRISPRAATSSTRSTPTARGGRVPAYIAPLTRTCSAST
jgi:hypothetical protein